MSQFQIHKTDQSRTRFVETPDAPTLGEGEIVVHIDRFGFSANNITYAVVGERLGYWQFFPPVGEESDDWGVLPVWGFADVVASETEAIPTGERLFGYFPPATHLVMKPEGVSPEHFFDGTAHRAELPKGYNIYRRVSAEPGYDKAGDNLRMLLFPLYITSFCLWDMLKDNDWFGAKQIILVSASSKTSIGLAYALSEDADAPATIGLTSDKNKEFVDGLGLYASCLTYDDLSKIEDVPSVIVDMAGNRAVLGHLHQNLGDNMLRSVNVGLTHWDGERGDNDLIQERSEMFFAPSVIQKRMKDWGPADFNARSSSFVMRTIHKSDAWLQLVAVDGLESIEAVYAKMRDGNTPPQQGLVIQL